MSTTNTKFDKAIKQVSFDCIKRYNKNKILNHCHDQGTGALKQSSSNSKVTHGSSIEEVGRKQSAADFFNEVGVDHIV